MLSKTVITFAVLLITVAATPKNSKKDTSSSSSSGSTSDYTTDATATAPSTTDLTTTLTSTVTMTSTTTQFSTSPTSSSSNNRRDFVNHCQDLGVATSDCNHLANSVIAHGKGVKVKGDAHGSEKSSSSDDDNSGQDLLNQCHDVSISALNCAQLSNLAFLDVDKNNVWVGALPSLYADPSLYFVQPEATGLIRF